jgi:WD40 repeat protein/serine/threonine protein kinase
MLVTMRCEAGHTWQAEQPLVQQHCPQCGQVAISIVPPAPAATDAAENDDGTDQLSPDDWSLSGDSLPPTRLRVGTLPPRSRQDPSTVARVELADSPDWTLDRLPLDESVSKSPNRQPIEIAGYEIIGELGRGGMGVVYQARQVRLNRLVALKMILAGEHAGERELERFHAEAEAVAALKHPGIVQIYEVGEANGRPYLAFEFIEGGSLAARLNGAPQPARDCARVVATLAETMHYAHSQGIIHRDLKPANVLLSLPSGVPALSIESPVAGQTTWPTLEPRQHVPLAECMPKITDFGLAKRLESAQGDGVPAGVAHTRTGAVIGTPSYLAPEQAAGKNREVGPAADIYALGAILYEMLTGRPPFRGESPLDTVLQVMHEDPVPPTQLQPKCPRDLEIICLKCLEKDPSKRYATAGELAEDLRRFLGGEPIHARSVTVWERAIKWAKRRPSVAALLAGLAITITATFAILIYFTIELSAAAEREAIESKKARQQQEAAEQARALAEEQRRQADLQRREAERQVELARRSLFALQLAQVAALADYDPRRGYDLLNDRTRCPVGLRDFTWHYLRAQCDRLRLKLDGHTKTISSLAFAAEVPLVVSGSWDQTARVWETVTGRTVATLRVSSSVQAVAITPDARLLAVADNDRTIKLYALPELIRRGEPLSKQMAPTINPFTALVGFDFAVRSLAISPDGKYLAAGNPFDSRVRVWKIDRLPLPKQPLLPLLKNQPPFIAPPLWNDPDVELLDTKQGVSCLSFSPDSKYLASGGSKGQVCVWDLGSEQLLNSFAATQRPLVALSVGRDDRLACCAQDDSVVRVWDWRQAQEKLRLKGHTRPVHAISFSPDSKLLASGSEDQTVRLWQTDNGTERTVLKGHTNLVAALAFSGDGLLASGGNDQTVRVWDLSYLERGSSHDQLRLSRDDQEVRAVGLGKWPSERSWVVAESSPRKLSVWEIQPVQATQRGPFREVPDELDISRMQLSRQFDLEGLPGSPWALAVAPQHPLVAAAAQPGRIYLWNLTKPKDQVQKQPPLPPKVNQGRVPLLSEPQSLPDAPKNTSALAISTDGQWLAAVGEGRLKVYSLANHQVALDARLGAEPISLCFSHDATLLAVGLRNQQVRFWDLPRLREYQSPLPSGLLNPIAMSFAPNDRLLAIGSEDGSIRLYDLVRDPSAGLIEFTMRPALQGHAETITQLCFSQLTGAPDSLILVSAGQDRIIKIWDPQTGQERGTLTGHTNSPIALHFTHGGKRLVSVDRDGGVRLWSGR